MKIVYGIRIPGFVNTDAFEYDYPILDQFDYKQKYDINIGRFGNSTDGYIVGILYADINGIFEIDYSKMNSFTEEPWVSEVMGKIFEPWLKMWMNRLRVEKSKYIEVHGNGSQDSFETDFPHGIPEFINVSWYCVTE